MDPSGYKVIFDRMHEGVCLHEVVRDEAGRAVDFRILDANPAYERMVGLDRDQVVGRLVTRIFGVEHPPYMDRCLAVAETGVPTQFQTRLGPTKIPCLASAFSLVRGQFAVLFLDIRDRVKSEERLASLARIPDEYPNPLIRVDPAGQILYANSAARSLVGSLTAVTGRIQSAQELGIARAWESGAKHDTPLAVTVDSGERRSYVVTVVPIKEAGYLNLYARDVSEETALAEKLRRAQKMDTVGRLASGIAHEFNNILTAILGYTELALMKPREDITEELKQIESASRRAGHLTSQFLAFSSRSMMSMEMIDLNRFVARVSQKVKQLVGEGIELEVASSSVTGRVKADPRQLEQAISNLCVNAREAMPQGGRLTIRLAEVTIDAEQARAHPDTAPGHYLSVSVSDTGVGMSKEAMDHLFEPFFTTKPVGKGTGLGLAMVYGLTRQCGGSVTCSSQPGRGTVVTMLFPRIDEVTSAPQAGRTGGTETILLAEDDDAVRSLTYAMLSSAGYRVLQAGDAREAIEISRAQDRVNLLLTDVLMPGMSGPELARRLLADRPSLKVLYMSGYLKDMGTSAIADATEAQFLQKPFTMSELLVSVRGILDARQSNRSVR